MLALASIIGIGFLSEAVCEDRPDGRLPFTVRTSIEMTRLVDPNPTRRHYRFPEFQWSSDGRSFASVLRRGNVRTGHNEFELLVIDADGAWNGRMRPDATRTLAQFQTDSQRHGIEHVRWIRDGRGLAFIGRGSDGVGSIFLIDLPIGTMRRLPTEGDVTSFAISPDEDAVLYCTSAEESWKSRSPTGYVVASDYLGDLVVGDPKDAAFRSVRCVVQNLENGRHVPIEMEPLTTPALAVSGVDESGLVAISPSGRWAIIGSGIARLPPAWRKYVSPRWRATPSRDVPTGHDVAAASLTDDAFGRKPRALFRYALLDMLSGKTEPLLDAPSPGFASDARVLWFTDDRVIIAPAFMPTSSGDEVRTVVAEVGLKSRTVLRIAEIGGRTRTGQPLLLTGVDLVSDTVVLREHEYLGSELKPKAYRKSKGVWIERPYQEQHPRRLNAFVAEELNAPPEIGLADTRSGETRIISDLNPQLHQVALEQVKPFDWTDDLGREFRGGLIVPSSVRAATRLPIVIQTYGFNDDEFLTDGPQGITTAYAARALASKGIVVLQMPSYGKPSNNRRVDGETNENVLFLKMMEGAIAKLDALRLIDTSRIGLIGFSRLGMRVHYALTFSRYRIAAATIADAVAATLWSYSLAYGSFPGMLQWEHDGIIGEPFWGDGVKTWVEHSPIFHLDRIHTPIRYEHLGRTVPEYWDVFAILKRHQKPIEMIHIPEATHVIQTPNARLTSQQGNVDWFCFWLKDEIDPDVAKRSQYARWEELRAQHEADLMEGDYSRTGPTVEGKRSGG